MRRANPRHSNEGNLRQSFEYPLPCESRWGGAFVTSSTGGVSGRSSCTRHLPFDNRSEPIGKLANGGPSRTRTYDQGIMSHRMTLRGHVSLGEGRQKYNRANLLLTLSFCQFCKSGYDWGLYRQCTYRTPPLLRMPKPGSQVLVPLLIKLGACLKRRTRRAMEPFFVRTLALKALFRCFGPKRG